MAKRGPYIADFFDELNNSIQQSRFAGDLNQLWLGGAPGPAGGSGQRPGGFIGTLLQTLVSYDQTEAATSGGSGTLLDNLNHIRADINALIYKNIVTVVSGQYIASSANNYIMANAIEEMVVVLPSASGIAGKEITVKRIDAGNYIVTVSGLQHIDDSITQTLTQNDAIKIVSDDIRWRIV